MNEHARLFRAAKTDAVEQLSEWHASEGVPYADLLVVLYDLRSAFGLDLWAAFPLNLPEYARRIKDAPAGGVAPAAAVMPLNTVGLEFIEVSWPEHHEFLQKIRSRPPGSVTTIIITAADDVMLTFSEVDQWPLS